MKHLQIKKLVISAMMLALCLLLPFLTGQIREIGRMLSPMHLPVLICGYVCGPVWGFAVGLVAAPLRSMIFSMPAVPECFFMAAELAVYGLMSGLFYRIFPKGKGRRKDIRGLFQHHRYSCLLPQRTIKVKAFGLKVSLFQPTPEKAF